jgi:hypothetical protein
MGATAVSSWRPVVEHHDLRLRAETRQLIPWMQDTLQHTRSVRQQTRTERTDPGAWHLLGRQST